MKSIFRKIIKGIDAAARFDIPIVTQIDAVIDMITSGDAVGATKEAEKVRDEITAIGTTHERRAVLRARLGTAGVAFLAPVIADRLGVGIPLVSAFLEAVFELLIGIIG